MHVALPVRAGRRRVDLESITCPVPTPARPAAKLSPRPSDFPPVRYRELMQIVYANHPRLRRLARKAERGPRITASEVVAAYRRTGAVPADCKGRTWDGYKFRRHANGASAFEVLFADDPRLGTPCDSDVPDAPPISGYCLASLTYGEEYAAGFSNAWCVELDAEHWEVVGERLSVWSPAYGIGHDDGTAARRAVCRQVRYF